MRDMCYSLRNYCCCAASVGEVDGEGELACLRRGFIIDCAQEIERLSAKQVKPLCEI